MSDYTPPGDGTRYDTPAKNAVRSHWVAFATHGTSSEQLSTHRILMLPGPQALECAAFKARGIDMRRCQGVERDEPAASAIARVMPALPLAKTTMQQFLSLHDLKRGDPFDSIWLDFDGKFHVYRGDIIAAIPHLRRTSGSCLGVTTFQGRDRDTIIETGVAISILKSCLSPAFFQRMVDTLSLQYAPHGLPSSVDDRATHYNLVARELNAITILLYGLAAAENGLAFTTRVDAAMNKVRGMCGKAFRSRSSRTPKNLPFPVITSLAFPRVFRETMVSLWPVDCMRFSYSFAPERLHSWFVRFDADATPRSLMDVLVQTQELWIAQPIHLLDGEAQPIAPVPFCAYCARAEERSQPEPIQKESKMRSRRRYRPSSTKRFTDAQRAQVLRDYDRLGTEQTQSKWQTKGFRRQQIAGIRAAAKRAALNA